MPILLKTAHTKTFADITQADISDRVHAIIGDIRHEGAGGLRSRSTTSDPDLVDLIAEVHRVLATSSARRMDIVPGVEAAGRALTDGAHLVVYNLATP